MHVVQAPGIRREAAAGQRFFAVDPVEAVAIRVVGIEIGGLTMDSPTIADAQGQTYAAACAAGVLPLRLRGQGDAPACGDGRFVAPFVGIIPAYVIHRAGGISGEAAAVFHAQGQPLRLAARMLCQPKALAQSDPGGRFIATTFSLRRWTADLKGLLRPGAPAEEHADSAGQGYEGLIATVGACLTGEEYGWDAVGISGGGVHAGK